VKKNETTVDTSFASAPSISPGEIIIGRVVSLNGQGEPCVDFPENPNANILKAISTISVTNEDIGKQVALLFANGNLNSPVIMGLIHNPLDAMLESFDQHQGDNTPREQASADVALESPVEVDDVLIDGKKITFEAQEQIVLRCGESSITLTKAGKILIRGKYLLNRSTGVNRIMGGSVQVN